MKKIKISDKVWKQLKVLAEESGMKPHELIYYWAGTFRWEDQRCMIGKVHAEHFQYKASPGVRGLENKYRQSRLDSEAYKRSTSTGTDPMGSH